MDKQCLICQKIKGENEYSREHIFPNALLRRMENNVLVISDICESCNNNFGLHVDAPLIKYWFVSVAKVNFDLKYADLESGEVVALTYMGHIEGMEVEGKVCEQWLSPGGDVFYNFHEPYSEIEYEEIVQGINPIHKRRKENIGEVVLLIKTNNPAWKNSLLATFNYYFKEHTKFVYPNPLVSDDLYPPPPKILLDTILSKSKTKNEFQISGTTGERFLAKLAIEFGHHVLNDSFKSSEQITLLRRFLRERDFRERKRIPVFALGPLKVEKQLKFPYQELNIENVHVIAFVVINSALFLYLNIYGKVSGAILVSRNVEHWQGLFSKGFVYFIAPALGQIFGPIRQCEDCNETCKIDVVRKEIMSRMDELPINPPPFNS